MQVNNFIQYLDDPAQLKNVAKNEMLPIIQEFPYCQTGQLMYAIQLNANNSILFDEQLKKAASICSDRIRLFEYIHQEEESVVNKNVIVDKDSEVKEIEEEEERVEVVKDEKNKESILEKFIPVEGEDELAILEKEYLTTAISSTVLIESEENVEEVPDVNKIVAEDEIDLFDENITHSFSSWLKHYNGDEKEPSSENKKEKVQDLIDKFIQEDPRIKPEKTEFYSPTNMARLSVTDDGIVSETLAVIHVDQGNFQEAINTYEKLILKNPKKRSYFAAQIKILKQKLK
jgi:tetratricopeptide (TPR) repeat protein